ncbi:PIN domain-containing protein [Planktothrix serta PCC 8927]|uniref:PIN domain-containing protein n=1 Tax=Planktothrix serta PCC 8927 TaxID=671068 RepID=A0A7Z9C251_9CYAN|nr:PIN domain-containing protein [Planktothrix serta]VXD25707.1 PIN domain-containing protein [Planktothrix serta PCC 8927]
MKKTLILDTSPLVASLDKSDRFHTWAIEIWKTTVPPFLTCEAVISEACFLLRKVSGGQDTVMALLDSGVITINFNLSYEISEIRQLMKQYNNVPMSLADACLVRMNELIPGSSVLSLDSDFRIYRKNKNEIIDLIIPDQL